MPQLVSTPPEDMESKKLFMEILRNVPDATSVYAGYPDGSYLQVISIVREEVRQVLSAPKEAAFAIRTIAITDDLQVDQRCRSV